MRAKKKHAVEYLALGVFYPKSRKKHPLREFPLDKVEVCVLGDLEHDTKFFPSLPKFTTIFQATTMDTDHAYFISQKKPWQPQILGINYDPTPFNSWNNVNNQFPPQ